MREMKKKGIYLLVSVGAIIAFTVLATTRLNLRNNLVALFSLFQGDLIDDRQAADDLAEDIKTKIGAVKLQAWCEETMARYQAGELITDGNSPYWSKGDIKLAEEEIPEFIKNVWPKQPDAPLPQPDAPLPQPDVSIQIDTNGEPKYIAISWYLHGLKVGPTDYVETYHYWYLRQVKPGIYVYAQYK